VVDPLPDDGSKAGSLRVLSLTARSDAPAADLADAIDLPAVAVDLAGWQLEGRWQRQWRRPVLTGTWRGTGEAGELTLAMPRPGRDWSRRWHPAATAAPVRLALPLEEGINPHQRYQLVVSRRGDGLAVERVLDLAGPLSRPERLGAPRPTSALPPSRIGACTHFGIAQDPYGPYAQWRDHARWLDLAAACGLGWIRDEVNDLVRQEDGSWRIGPGDEAWLGAARQRGLRVIACIGFPADAPVAELAAKALAVARRGEPVAAIELGNEAFCADGWRERHGGDWNGRGADGGTAPWVKAHLAAVNAVAEHLRQAGVAIPVLGIGGPATVIARELELGLSPAVTGVVDHPYSHVTPPETVWFGPRFAGRDGIAPGDAACSQAGVMAWLQPRLGGRRLWFTEFGWSTYRNDLANTEEQFAAVDEPTQAAYLVRRHLLHLAHGAAASIQYALADDRGSDAVAPEGNFGLVRADGTRKPSWFATRRLCSLFAGAERDPAAAVSVLRAPLHYAQTPAVVPKAGGAADLPLPSGVEALAFHHPEDAALRTLAVWSQLPPGPHPGRSAELAVEGWSGFGHPVAIGLCSGRRWDQPFRRDGRRLVLEVVLADEPLAIRWFR
ncbi:MAG: hypothetical protein L6R48_14690, partial [Planctomycetes bacterium]|nr:hypothetical protein [Planctomycetota bacterium]